MTLKSFVGMADVERACVLKGFESRWLIPGVFQKDLREAYTQQWVVPRWSDDHEDRNVFTVL